MVVNDYGADYMVRFSTFSSILVYNYFVTSTNPDPDPDPNRASDTGI